MRAERLRFAESVKTDWSNLAAHEKEAATTALQHIDGDPIAGAPLFEPLRGLWSYRAGHLRIVYRIMPEARVVVVLSIARAADLS